MLGFVVRALHDIVVVDNAVNSIHKNNFRMIDYSFFSDGSLIRLSFESSSTKVENI